MKILLTPLIILYRLYFGIVFFGVVLIFYPIFWLLLLSDKHYNKVMKLKVVTAKIILFFVGVKHKVIKPIPQINSEQYVICANHQSYLDILSMYSVLKKHKFLFIGKKELLGWPIINIFFKRIDIAIDRMNSREALKALIRAKNEIENGWSINIFPEGKIPKDTPQLNYFKSGPFKLAIQNQVPILPITLIDNWKLFGVDPIVNSPARPGVSRVIIHEPIETKGMTEKDLVYLRNKTFDVINEPLLRYNSKQE